MFANRRCFFLYPLDEIADDYIKDCEEKQLYDWRYYYIKYDCFRPESYGKYDWDDFNHKPYEFRAFKTKDRESSSSYQPFLKALLKDDDKEEDRFENNGRRMRGGENYLFCENDAYVLKERVEQDGNVDFKEIRRYTVPQSNGIDTVERIATFQPLYDRIAQNDIPESCTLS